MAKKIPQKEKYEDLGLGTKNTSGGFRSLNKDGSFNVKKTNVRFFERLNFFHSLITMSWSRFFAVILLTYFCANILFASIYTVLGIEYLTGMDSAFKMHPFIESFFFSAQTITTLGYGRVAPIGFLVNVVAAIESMIGLLFFALATGLLYGRFSKPRSRIKYSSHGVIAPFGDINGFMFRMVNPQRNQLLEVEVTVMLSMKREHTHLRDFHLLALERSRVVFFPYTWTVVHPITEDSPLYQISEKDMFSKDAEFIVMVKAFDESFSQTVYSRSSYKGHELRWGEKFVYVVSRENDSASVDVSRIDETEKAALNK